MPKTDFFWTDRAQAIERINHSVVLYDGQPVYVDNIDEAEDKPCRIRPRALIYELPNKIASRKFLNSGKFGRFRELPKLGWMNTETGLALFVSRRVIPGRTHGLSSGNTLFNNFNQGNNQTSIQSGNYDLATQMFDKGFVDMHNGVYPSLLGVLANIQPLSAIAYSRNFCVHKDMENIIWLYRGVERVGIFTGANTLNLLSRHAYLREEIMADPLFTINTIREL